MILRPTSTILFRPFTASNLPTTQCQRCRWQDQYTHHKKYKINNSDKYGRTQARYFSFSRRLLLDSNEPAQTHYEVLKVPTNVTKADLKKQFYVLSKETHPDMHPDDPSAGERFAQISEAYSVLGNDEKRRKYDREVLGPMQRQRRGRRHEDHPSGSFAGSRPATGLSKRRGTFRGPPPSFYAHGNPSENTQRQSQSQSQSQTSEEQAGSFRASSYAEPGQWDPAFNSNPVYKTQSAEDKRRNDRRAAAMAAAQASADEEGNFWARFIIVSAVVAVSVSLGSVVVNMHNAPRGGMTKSDGSRRDVSRNEKAKY